MCKTLSFVFLRASNGLSPVKKRAKGERKRRAMLAIPGESTCVENFVLQNATQVAPHMLPLTVSFFVLCRDRTKKRNKKTTQAAGSEAVKKLHRQKLHKQKNYTGSRQ